MPEIAYLSVTGEVKIPLKVRTRLGLKPGQKFEVQVQGRDLILVQLSLPAEEQVKEFVEWTKENPLPEGHVIPAPRSATRKPSARKKPPRGR